MAMSGSKLCDWMHHFLMIIQGDSLRGGPVNEGSEGDLMSRRTGDSSKANSEGAP